MYKFSQATLERLRQKKLQLVELQAQKYNFASRDKALASGQYNMGPAQAPKDPNCGQTYSLAGSSSIVSPHDATVMNHGQYTDYDQGLKNGQYTLTSPVNKHDADNSSVKSLEGQGYSIPSQEKPVVDSSAYNMMPTHQRDFTYNTLE